MHARVGSPPGAATRLFPRPEEADDGRGAAQPADQAEGAQDEELARYGEQAAR
jgi:hypothetical protein